MSQQQPIRSGTAGQQVRQAVHESRPGIELLGRMGYAAKGAVYALIGVLAAQAALGRGGETTGTEGALSRILQAPFGRGLLAIIAVGLAGHALWRFVQAGMDTENKGGDAKGLLARAAYAGIGVIYIGLAISAATLALRGGGNEGDATQSRTAWLLEQPAGRWLLGLVGLGVIGAGLYQFYRAYRMEFREKLRLDEMSPEQERWAITAGRFGFAARGVVFVLTGAFLIAAALQARPEEAQGLGGVLATLAQQQYGQWLLGIVALGLIAYAVLMFVQMRYRRMLIR